MDLNLFRSFCEIANQSSLNQAAARLRVSQSALSRQLQSLEQEFGGPLFERTSQGVRLTDAGQVLREKLPPVLSRFDALFDEIRQIAGGRRQELRIGFLLSATQILLTPSLADFQKIHPQVKVRLYDLSPGEQISALREGRIDIALIGQEGASLSRDFYTQRLATLKTVAVLSSSNPLSRKHHVTLKDLKSLPFILYPDKDMPGRNEWIKGLCRSAGFRPRMLTIGNESISECLAQIVSEDATTIFPDYFKHVTYPGVTLVPLDDAKASWDLLVAWQRGKPSRSTKDFIGILAKIAAAKIGVGTSSPKNDARPAVKARQ